MRVLPDVYRAILRTRSQSLQNAISSPVSKQLMRCKPFSSDSLTNSLAALETIINESAKKNQLATPETYNVVTPNIIQRCINTANRELRKDSLSHYPQPISKEIGTSIISKNPLAKDDSMAGFLINTAPLKTLEEKLTAPITTSITTSERTGIITRTLSLIQTKIEELMTDIMLGGPKNSEGAQYEVLEAIAIVDRLTNSAIEITKSKHLEFANSLEGKHSIVAVPSNFFALGLPDFVNLFFLGSDHIMIIAPPQGIPFWYTMQNILYEAGLPESNLTVATVNEFPDELISLSKKVSAVRMVGSTNTYTLIAESIGDDISDPFIHLGGEKSGNPNVNIGDGNKQQARSIANGNLGNGGELCSSSTSAHMINGTPVDENFTSTIQEIMDKQVPTLATDYSSGEELKKFDPSRPPSVTLIDERSQEVWGPYVNLSSLPPDEFNNTTQALTLAITSGNFKQILDNLSKSYAGNMYVAVTNNSQTQPFVTNPLATVPPCSFGTATSFAVGGDQHGQNTIPSNFINAKLDSEANNDPNTLQILFNIILDSATVSPIYEGYPMYNKTTENLDPTTKTPMKAYTIFSAKPIVINITNINQVNRLKLLLNSLKDSPFKHNIIINTNDIPKKDINEKMSSLEHKENSYTYLERQTLSEISKTLQRPALFHSFSELEKETYQLVYKEGHSINTSLDMNQLAMKLITQATLCIAVNPEETEFDEAQKEIAEPLLQQKLKTGIVAKFKLPPTQHLQK